MTHRCHNRGYLLKFAKDRESYRCKLREGLAEFSVSLLDYAITCNHVHLLIDTTDKSELSGFMRKVAGEFARNYNRRKRRMNAFWGDNFHATLVEDGRYLYECLLYIELNMARCGVVRHPRDWPWVGYHEIMGCRKRYRLVDLDRLCWRMRAASLEVLQRTLKAGIEERIARDEMKRVEHWTQSLCVGSRSFVEQSQGKIFTRLETEIFETAEDLYVLKEQPTSYGDKRT